MIALLPLTTVTARPLPPPAFFQTGATLVATLAVSLFLQVHYVERVSDQNGRYTRTGPVWGLVLAGVVFVGEAAALSALVHGPSRFREVLVYLAITAEGVLLVFSAVQPALAALRAQNRRWALPVLGALGLGFAVLVVAVAVYP